MKIFATLAALALTIAFVNLPASGAEDDATPPRSAPRAGPKRLKVVDYGTDDPRLKGFRAPEGVEIEIVAQEPTVVNPVAMTFSDAGTPFVLEWRPSPGDEWKETPETIAYKDGRKRTIATIKKRVEDAVKTLSKKRNGDVYDDAKIVLEDELPSSILLHDGWLYAAGRGTVRRHKQSKPDGPYDVKETIARGFCGFHRHQVSGTTIGNDGWLYIASGDEDNYVEGSDGSRATVLRSGAVFRCRPDGSRMRTYAVGFRNPYRGVAFDSAGNMFHVDRDSEVGSKSSDCRLLHVAEGMDFGWRLRRGARCCGPDRVGEIVRGDQRSNSPGLLKTGSGSPSGLFVYDDTRFPEHFRGLLFYPDSSRRLIRAYRVERMGATFQVVEEFEFLKSDDPLFHPCQITVGPDGAMYIVDERSDIGGGNRLWGDGVHGRIYRVSWSGTADHPALPLRPLDSWSKIAKLNDEDLLEALADEEASIRERARKEIVRRGDKSRGELLKMLRDDERLPQTRVAAMGALQSFWNEEVQMTVEEILANGDADLKRLAADALGLNAAAGDERAHNRLLKALNDDDPAVRRAVALAMSHVAAAGAAEALVNHLAFEKSTDVYLFDGLVHALENLGKPGIDRLLAFANSGIDKDLDRVVQVFATLRTRPAAEALPGLLKNPHLGIGQRTALMRSFGNYRLDPPVATVPILDYLLANAEAAEVKLAALDVLSALNVLNGDKAEKWLLALLDDPDARVRLSAVAAVREVRLLKAVPILNGWLNDASRPAAERQAAVEALRVLKTPRQKD